MANTRRGRIVMCNWWGYWFEVGSERAIFKRWLTSNLRAWKPFASRERILINTTMLTPTKRKSQRWAFRSIWNLNSASKALENEECRFWSGMWRRQILCSSTTYRTIEHEILAKVDSQNPCWPITLLQASMISGTWTGIQNLSEGRRSSKGKTIVENI